MLRLNLLPAERKYAWALAQRLQQWRGAMIVTVAACVLTNTFLFGLDRYQGEAVKASNAELQEWQMLDAKRESGQVTKSTTQLNTTVLGLQGLFTSLSTSAATVSQFIAGLPGDIHVASLKFAPDGAFVMTGTTTTRASFLALRTALDESPLVKNLATDSTASLREKVPFTYTGQLVLTP